MIDSGAATSKQNQSKEKLKPYHFELYFKSLMYSLGIHTQIMNTHKKSPAYICFSNKLFVDTLHIAEILRPPEEKSCIPKRRKIKQNTFLYK
jgi:hypothetical protein